MTESQPAIVVTVPSGWAIQCRPRPPGWPPASPNAGTRRCPVSVVTVIGSAKRSRRTLLAADHATPAPGGVGRHIERHVVLADRLWRGDPPELWEAAQRLLDAGQDRHVVLHTLMAVLDHADGDEAALIAVLRELEAEEP